MAGPVITRPQYPVSDRLGADIAELLLCCFDVLVVIAVFLVVLGNIRCLQPGSRRVEQRSTRSSSSSRFASRDGSYFATSIRL